VALIERDPPRKAEVVSPARPALSAAVPMLVDPS